jgi:hypothetical protein
VPAHGGKIGFHAEVAIDHLFPPYTQEKNEVLTLWFEY